MKWLGYPRRSLQFALLLAIGIVSACNVFGIDDIEFDTEGDGQQITGAGGAKASSSGSGTGLGGGGSSDGKGGSGESSSTGTASSGMASSGMSSSGMSSSGMSSSSGVGGGVQCPPIAQINGKQIMANNKCYVYIDDTVDRDQASQACNSLDMNLVSISSNSEFLGLRLAGLPPGPGDVADVDMWTDGSDEAVEGQYSWTQSNDPWAVCGGVSGTNCTGQFDTRARWCTDQPNDPNDGDPNNDQDCVYLRSAVFLTDSGLRDGGCGDKNTRRILCEQKP